MRERLDRMRSEHAASGGFQTEDLLGLLGAIVDELEPPEPDEPDDKNFDTAFGHWAETVGLPDDVAWNVADQNEHERWWEIVVSEFPEGEDWSRWRIGLTERGSPEFERLLDE